MIKFKRLTETAKIPERQTEGAAGFDIYADENTSLKFAEVVTVGTGIACSIPIGWVGKIEPRSGLAFKYEIDTMAGVIDSDYRGEIRVLLINHGITDLAIKKGDRIAQMVVVPCMTESMEVDDLDDTERGDNGFGSTGR